MALEIKIKYSMLKYVIIAIAALLGLIALVYSNSPFTAPFILALALITWSAYYAYSNSKKLSTMCCMMSGMTFGIVSGFFIGTLAALITSDFLIGIVIGTVAGLLFGMPLGNMGSGGHLGRMEGVMAGPMGGMMGGMLGIMIRFYNLELFMPFFMFVIILTVWEMIYAVRRDIKEKIPTSLLYGFIALSIIAVASTIIPDYSNISLTGSTLVFGNKAQETSAAANIGKVQEIDMRIKPISYDPNYIVVKKGIPVRINLKADSDAGCTRSIVFPDFGIQRLVPAGGSDTIEFTPTEAGTFQFRCSMNMARGTLVVEN